MDDSFFMSPEWVREVCDTPENDVRAHQIALTYFHLAKHLDELIHGKADGKRPANANWFNFGLWGTLSVSQVIGNDRPLQRLNAGAAMSLRRVLTPVILNVKASRRQEVARSLSWAQVLIFISSCTALRLFSKYALAKKQQPFTGEQLSHELEKLNLPHALSDPFGVSRDRHANNVAKAFRYYSRARTARDLARSQLVLGGNVLLTEIEQDIADPAVSVVLDLVPRRVGEAIDWRLAKLAQRFRGIPTHFSSLVLPFKHTEERRAVDALWSRFMTDQALVMALPTESLRVGRDIPPLRRDAPYFAADMMFPKNLASLSRHWPCSDEHSKNGADRCADCEAGLEDHLDVAERIRSLDRTVGDGRGSAARDWRRWDERMNWAVTLMRSRQHDETLFWRPYSTQDEKRIRSRELPHRTGDASEQQVQAPVRSGANIDVDGDSQGARD